MRISRPFFSIDSGEGEAELLFRRFHANFFFFFFFFPFLIIEKKGLEIYG